MLTIRRIDRLDLSDDAYSLNSLKSLTKNRVIFINDIRLTLLKRNGDGYPFFTVREGLTLLNKKKTINDEILIWARTSTKQPYFFFIKPQQYTYINLKYRKEIKDVIAQKKYEFKLGNCYFVGTDIYRGFESNTSKLNIYSVDAILIDKINLPAIQVPQRFRSN